MLKNKKFLVALLFLAIIMVVSACGGGDDGGNDEGTDTGQSEDNGGGDTTASSGDAKAGAEVYQSNCMSCHGKEGAGGSAPSLQGNDVASDHDAVVKQVKNGGGGMPAFEGTLSKQEIADVSAYISEKVAGMK
ncbi:cytochrome C551 [Virgibacillus phasianinus]|uniref:Cytochrome C551 n=1 Tax=Virgibacillus phasianinus TaxID=2017483 RepID=A0A220U1E8_9BACI|nr:cytochrome c [Virgibacillus phasianinus]ASK61929.1 cytochrome C551 [Virgibacillus phasianinus]